MFRFIFVILLQYSIIFPTGFCQDSNTQLSPNGDEFSTLFQNFTEDLDVMMLKKQHFDGNSNQSNKSLPSSCMEAAAGRFTSGVYEIQLEKLNNTPFAVWCNEDIDYGGWLVFQRRESDTVNFNRDWNDYKEGFGNVTGNYWIGLEKLHALTTYCEQELYIEMERFNGKSYYAKYSMFVIGNELENYSLKKLGKYEGTSGNSLLMHQGMGFSTIDRDNDNSAKHCAARYQGGWWFEACYKCHLNGVYKNQGAVGGGVDWSDIKKDESLKFAQMMIRPTQNCLRRLMLINL